MEVQVTDISERLGSLFAKCTNDQLEAARNYIILSQLDSHHSNHLLIQIEERRL